jgi:hypothetical protein
MMSKKQAAEEGGFMCPMPIISCYSPRYLGHEITDQKPSFLFLLPAYIYKEADEGTILRLALFLIIRLFFSNKHWRMEWYFSTYLYVRWCNVMLLLQWRFNGMLPMHLAMFITSGYFYRLVGRRNGREDTTLLGLHFFNLTSLFDGDIVSKFGGIC